MTILTQLYLCFLYLLLFGINGILQLITVASQFLKSGFLCSQVSIIISAFMAFAVFYLYPMAPPRYFDGNHGATNLGFTDTIFTYWNVKENSIKEFYNSFAAMPSLHQGWTLMVCIGIWWMTESKIARVIATALPIAIFFGITATANHWVLDAVGGAVVILASIGITALLFRYLDKRRIREGREPLLD